MLWKLKMPYSRTRKILEERIFHIAMGKFWIFIWKSLDNPKIDADYCCIKHCACYACLFYYL